MTTRKWLYSTLLAVLGGGIAGAFSAAMDPTKYTFPHDFGSGKLWKFFFMGGALTLAGMALHSPLGQRLMAGFKESQAQLQQSQNEIAQTKSDLQAGAKPPAKKS